MIIVAFCKKNIKNLFSKNKTSEKEEAKKHEKAEDKPEKNYKAFNY